VKADLWNRICEQLEAIVSDGQRPPQEVEAIWNGDMGKDIRVMMDEEFGRGTMKQFIRRLRYFAWVLARSKEARRAVNEK